PSIVWTPYIAGAILGVVFALSLVAFGRPLGVSAGVQQGARLLASVVGKGGPAVPSPAGLWALWVLAGVAMGGTLSAFLRARSGAPSMVAAGESRARTWLVAFGAGVLLQVAATLAGGCTSGLALSGGIVLAPAAFVFMAGMFIGGIPTAWVAAHLHHRHQGRTP
ncbi:MAG TPA: YeeE/YedE thiosulfate transporter family protein, partial [Polyangia bacterium]|nr:YeeE/YedE thiosulfate transporter family protein [Polyangia bacterium]